MKTASRTWTWRFAHPPDRVWPILADTKRFNEAAGIAKHAIAEITQPDRSVKYTARLKLGPIAIRWEERPVEWVHGQRFTHCRAFDNGPFRSLCATLILTGEGAGSRVDYLLEVVPANLLGQLILATGFLAKIGRTFTRLADDVRAYLDGGRDRPYPSPRLDLDEATLARLAATVERVEATPYGHGLAQRLADHILLAQESDLLRMRPLELARYWGVDERDAVECMLQATKAGMLSLRWELLCPNCRGAKASAGSLDALPTGAHCPSCNIDYGREFAANVEVVFRPVPAIRDLTAGEFCLFGPMTTPHVKLQQTLGPGAARTVPARLDPGTYRLRALHPGGEVTIDWRGGGFPTIEADGTTIGTGTPAAEGEVRLVNRSAREQTLLIEDRTWIKDALTAHRLTTSQAFRDLFAAEALRPGDEVGIETVALLFTDLEGSTALYTRIGDAVAFALVRDHFAYLSRAVRDHNGAIVKTIGDAVMAAFVDPADAVKAALAIQANVAALNAAHAEADLVIKIGVHAGSCIAVTLNDRLDYFGSTVNLAARLQGRSRGGEVVLSRAIAADPGVAAVLRGYALAEESSALKGFDEDIGFYRLTHEARIAASPVS